MASPYFVRLANRPDLVDSWQLKYLHAGNIYSARGPLKSRDLQVADFGAELQHGDHHADAFYQGEKKPAKVIFVGGTYCLGRMSHTHPETGFKVWERFGNRARLIDVTGDIKRSKFYLPGTSSDHVWDWRIILACGSEVDVEDALRFACSLFHNEAAGPPSSRYFDFWSLGSGQRLNNALPGPPPPAAPNAVAGAAVGSGQALQNRVQDLETENERLRKRIAELEGTSAPGAGSGGKSPARKRQRED